MSEQNRIYTERIANEGRKKPGQFSAPWESVELETVTESPDTAETSFPETITRLGKAKCTYLIDAIARINHEDDVLELFGGSNLSTALISQRNPHHLVSLDLHNQLSESGDVNWRYATQQNYDNICQELGIRRKTAPEFVSADAGKIPFADGTFSLIVAPDSPRTASSRTSIKNRDAGKESELSYEEQEELFLNSATESLRVLKEHGQFVGTAPISWAQKLSDLGYSNVDIISSLDLPEKFGDDIKRYDMVRSIRFATRGFDDPVVYIRCTK